MHKKNQPKHMVFFVKEIMDMENVFMFLIV